MSKYMHGERKRADIINAGLDLWRSRGVAAISARSIAKAVGLNSHASVLHHFVNSADLVDQVKREAIARKDAVLVCQLITTADPLVTGWPPETRGAWLSAGMAVPPVAQQAG